jgi:hypothetical protein
MTTTTLSGPAQKAVLGATCRLVDKKLDLVESATTTDRERLLDDLEALGRLLEVLAPGEDRP